MKGHNRPQAVYYYFTFQMTLFIYCCSVSCFTTPSVNCKVLDFAVTGWNQNGPKVRGWAATILKNAKHLLWRYYNFLAIMAFLNILFLYRLKGYSSRTKWYICLVRFRLFTTRPQHFYNIMCVWQRFLKKSVARLFRLRCFKRRVFDKWIKNGTCLFLPPQQREPWLPPFQPMKDAKKSLPSYACILPFLWLQIACLWHTSNSHFCTG